MRLTHPPHKVALEFLCHVEVCERGSEGWLPFTDEPVPESQAEEMCAGIEKNHPGIEARMVQCGRGKQ